MNFSEPIKSHNGQAIWSEDGYLLASASGPRLTIWDAASLEVLQVFTTVEAIDKIEFSPDGEFILAVSLKSSETNIFSINHPDWSGRICEGAAGLLAAEWSPDSRYILTTAEFSVKLTIWSLTSKSIFYIRNPKTLRRSVEYSRDKSLAAVAERQNCRDVVNILSASDWSLLRQIECATADLAGLAWSPGRDCFVVWDSPLAYRLQVFTLDGREELDYSAYDHQLGVKTVQWSPSGQLLAVASYDNKIRIFDTLVWSLVHDIEHLPTLHEGEPVTCRANVFQEEDLPLGDVDARLAIELGGVLLVQSKYRLCNERPLYLDFVKSDPKKGPAGNGSLKIGVGVLEWSGCGRYIASRCDSLSGGIWIWDLTSLQLVALLLHKDSVKDVKWDPSQPRLAAVTGGPALYLWTPLGGLVGRVPPVSRGEMAGLLEVRWNPRGGRALALANREQTVLCRLKMEESRRSAGEDSDRDRDDEEDDDLDLEPSRERDSSS